MKKKGYFQQDVQLFEQLREAYARMKDHEINTRGKAPKMLEIDTLNEYSYLLTKLRLYLRQIILQEFLNPESIDLPTYTFDLLEQQLELHKDLVTRTPVLYSYREMIKFLQKDYMAPEASRAALQMLDMLKNFREHISITDYLDLVSVITNWCTKGGNKGNLSLRAPVFYSQVLIVHAGAVDQKRSYIIPLTLFGNIVKGALAKQEEIPWELIELKGLPPYKTPFNPLDWVYRFIKKYSKYLVSDKKEAFVDYCLALWRYAKGDFSECYRLLRSIKAPRKDMLHINVKLLLLRTMYELESTGQPIPRSKDGDDRILSIDMVKDSLRHQLDYIDKKTKRSSYLIKEMKTFLLRFGELYAFFRRYHNVYKTQESSLSFDKKKYDYLKSLDGEKFILVEWVREKIKEIN